MLDTLPDSRLSNPKLGAVVADWQNPDKSIVRLEMVPIFCANCGTEGGHVPAENMTFAFWLCDTCAETWAPLAGTLAVPDQMFWDQVRAEMIEKFGRVLTTQETNRLAEQGWGPLAKLVKESPIKAKG